ncbi:MAG TPA: hypothetical protein VFM27_03415, partial [Acidimicrobiales bacterium]|nr:hypothetical protein [Acidimicrobiales bacterium]
TVAVSDDPMSSTRIARFAASTDPWIVAVRMVSEGVDIPRLRVGVYATTTTTELFFRQAVGRFVRWTRGVPRQKAYLFIPDDLRLRTWATQIADARRHSLRKPERNGDERPDGGEALDVLVHPDDRGDQLSMFAALSAVVTGSDESSVFDVDEAALDHLDRLDRLEDGGGGDAALEMPLPALPGGPRPGTAAPGGPGSYGAVVNPRQERSRLREHNAKLVQDLVWATGMGHAQVNGQLNRSVGLRRIDEATVEQLRRRATEAERWLAKL